MISFFIQSLCRSFSMALVVMVYALAVLLFKRRYSAKSFYTTGTVILLGFLIPFRPHIVIPAAAGMRTAEPSAAGVFLHRILTAPERGLISYTVSTTVEHTGYSSVAAAATVWLAGAFFLLMYHGLRHIRFMKMVHRWSTEITDPAVLAVFEESKITVQASPRLKLRGCSCISSPTLTGLFQPVILLPDTPLTADDLRLVFKHELVHYKRNDLIYKSAMVLAAAVNWFNPAVYLLAGLTAHFCELSCDEETTEGMNEHDRYHYAAVLLCTAGRKSSAATAFSTLFYGGRENMKLRISTIMCASKKRFAVTLLAGCAVLTVAAGSAFSIRERMESHVDNTEIETIFSETFDNTFREDNFPGMVITYDENEVPTVTDPNSGVVPETVTASTRYSENGFYSSSDCSDSSLVFYIPKDEAVEVTDSYLSTSAAKVKYAGSAGYMKKSRLKF